VRRLIPKHKWNDDGRRLFLRLPPAIIYLITGGAFLIDFQNMHRTFSFFFQTSKLSGSQSKARKEERGFEVFALLVATVEEALHTYKDL
jgi:hypothetical protein